MAGAVVSAAEGAVRILLAKLGDVLADKYRLLSGVRKEVQELKDELESMSACLMDLDADSDDDHNNQTRIWMKQVRELAYDAEDCLDIFGHRLGSRHGDSEGCVGRLRSLIHVSKTMNVRHNLALEIQNLKTRAQKVSDRRRRYKVVDAGATPTLNNVFGSSNYVDLDRRFPTLTSDETQLVGMDDRTKEVINMLDEEDEARLRVVSIVGFGGLGKTTLALSVYRSPAMQGLKRGALVAVSQNYDLRALLESILKQLVPRPTGEQLVQRPTGEHGSVEANTTEDPLKGIEGWDIPKLIGETRNYSENERYFVILDDMWKPVAWDNLRTAFPDNHKESRILITTRSHHVAKYCSSNSHDRVYDMKPLPDKESKQLFFKRAFESDELPSQYEHLADVSKAILRKCNGLPLAIVSIGGMLARRQNKTEADWRRVCDRLGSELETNPTLEGMGRILSLSYNDLPYHLKACFLYLSVFPEDYEIKRGPLVRRWAAEGFISGTHGLNLEEVARSYFDEFVSRSIIIPAQIGSTSEVRTCRVHDIMLEVITSKSIQGNFISLLGSSKYKTTGQDKIRRLSIHGGDSKEQDFSNRNLSHVRSLTILGCKEKPVPINFSQLRVLRVLDLEGCRWLSNGVLKDICKLSQLRYLSLRNTEVSKLPKQVGKLKELVTIDIRKTDITELPGAITQLENLKHLIAGTYNYFTSTHSYKRSTYYEAVMIPRGLENMKSLERISHVEISSSFHAMHEVGKLSQLTRLSAINSAGGGEEKWEPFAASLSELSNSLRYLSVGGQKLEFLVNLRSPPLFLQDLRLEGRLSTLPPWISSLSNLLNVSLQDTCLGSELIEALGKLPSLLSLKLLWNSHVGCAVLCFERDQFPRLNQLVVDLHDIVELSFQGGAPHLKRLTLIFLGERTREISSSIEKLPKLREVELYHPGGSAVERVNAAAKSHPNHPRVTIEND